MTYRWKEHVGPGDDFHLGFRSREDARSWIDADPVRRLAETVDPAARAEIEDEVEAEVAAAIAFAENSPFPDAAELMKDVYMEV